VIAIPWALKHLFSARATYSSEASKKMERMMGQKKLLNTGLCSIEKMEKRREVPKVRFMA
jgi:hypothetical protein